MHARELHGSALLLRATVVASLNGEKASLVNAVTFMSEFEKLESDLISIFPIILTNSEIQTLAGRPRDSDGCASSWR